MDTSMQDDHVANLAQKNASVTATSTASPITREQLAKYDGTDPSLPRWLSIKGTVFDVSANTSMYGQPGKGYSCFLGKDCSYALGKSSTNSAECAITDYSTLTPEERVTLDNWLTFFTKKYPIVGQLVMD